MAINKPNYVPRPDFDPPPPTTPFQRPDWLERLDRPLEFSPPQQGEPVPYHKRRGTPQEYWKSPVGPGLPGWKPWGTGGRPHLPYHPIASFGNGSGGWQDIWKNFRYQGV